MTYIPEIVISIDRDPDGKLLVTTRYDLEKPGMPGHMYEFEAGSFVIRDIDRNGKVVTVL